ncbi:hypothetical protein RP726_00335 [Candidatus Methylospira mobilis]|uniref:hypothetical protein n=1 Tax=Candidatus Methylospira mobilis TaxID=1808979 RepID=UPI0028E9D460|nr:hypothetical protein [Candidatus Methylospira mobilis]WNV04882.1 hypothetical protein RP726_00335 [Candidatus Methylospira mobilis]
MPARSGSMVRARIAPFKHPVASLLPATEQLLQQGGDARVVVDPATGFTRYGCTYRPDAELLAFGSSTASIISDTAFAAADALRERLVQALYAGTDPELLYGAELERIRKEFLRMSRLDDLPGLECIFSASGTDLHLLASLWLCSAQQTPSVIIMVDPTETGSGVSTALRGRHFGSCAIFGAPVQPDTALVATAITPAIVHIALRDVSGNLRSLDEIDAEMTEATEQAIRAGCRVLLIPIDVSKTGIMAPSPSGVMALYQHHRDRLDVMVDACQFRLSNATLRFYLEQGYMVALTGSKFLSGPTFSAMLLLPRAAAARLAQHPAPPELAAYSSRVDWPEGWVAARYLNRLHNFGLLLRLEAALEEFRRFCAIPETLVAAFIDRFSAAISTHTERWGEWQWLPPPPLQRTPLLNVDSWDSRQTIFPFLLFHPGDVQKKAPLSREETAQVYRQLRLPQAGGRPAATARCELGQPVPCGFINAIPVSVLRLCLSARLLVEAAQDTDGHGQAVIARAVTVLDKTYQLLLAGGSVTD